jgi:phage portal protein BeeE
MGFWSRVADIARRRSGESDDRLWGEWAGGGQSNAGVPVNSITAMRHVACLACVSILACDVAKIPFDIYRRLPDGGKEVFKDHPLHRLMRHPNNWQTALRTKQKASGQQYSFADTPRCTPTILGAVCACCP